MHVATQGSLSSLFSHLIVVLCGQEYDGRDPEVAVDDVMDVNISDIDISGINISGINISFNRVLHCAT